MNSPFVQPIWSSAAAEKVREVPRRAGGYHHAFNESLEATPPVLLAGQRLCDAPRRDQLPAGGEQQNNS